MKSKQKNTTRSDKYRISETDQFRKKISLSDFSIVTNKLHDYVYPQLQRNPFFGLNIKRLRGKEFENVYRYRIGQFRLFFTVVDPRTVVIFDIQYRKDAY